MDQDSLFKQYKGVFEDKEETPKGKKGGFEYAYSPFALQDAIGEKNIKKIWIEYSKLRFMGIEAEEIIHKIVSKVRDMSAIDKGASREDLGLKDYPYNKSKRDLKNWKKEDLESLYAKIIEIYHLSRMGARPNDYSVGQGDELDVAMEKVILSI